MYLISPLVVGREVDVVDEDDQFFAGRWAVRRAHSLVHVALDAFLQKVESRHSDQCAVDLSSNLAKVSSFLYKKCFKIAPVLKYLVEIVFFF